jgi:hypothetical protein
MITRRWPGTSLNMGMIRSAIAPSRAVGDESGTGLRETSYGANALNQYTNAINPAVAQVTGFATTPATVSINSSPAYGKSHVRRLW